MKDTIELFITARLADGRAPRTIKDYRRTLSPFLEWCTQNSKHTATLTRDDIRSYVVVLRSHGWREATTAIYIRNLRAFLRWLYDEHRATENLALAIKAPRQAQRFEIPITPDEVQLLLDTCASGSFHDTRDRALILLLSDTGLRVGELIRLKVGDWRREPDNSGSYLLVYAPKTSTYRYAILGHYATEALCGFVALRPELYPASPLFSTEAGGPLAIQSVIGILFRRGTRAGLERCRCHPHIFRKAFVTGALDNGMDQERVRVLAGWTTMSMFRIYADSSLAKLRQAHRLAGPVDHMGLK